MSNVEKLERLAESYRKARHSFRDSVEELVSLSVQLGGTKSRDGREYWSSVLSSNLTLTSMTLDKIIPPSAEDDPRNLWDLSSVAALVRGMVENYLILFWLCVEPPDQPTWDYRLTLLTIVDNRARYRLTEEIEGEQEPDDFVEAQKCLADRLAGMELFQQLDPRRQRELLRGDRMPFIQDDVIHSLAIDRLNFRRYYRYLSSFVHSGTISFFRMTEQNRGHGEFSEHEAMAIEGIMTLASLVIRAAVADVRKIHLIGG